MAKILSKSQQLYLLAGWITISVTNFLGFSVVIVQLLLFLLPAFALVLNTKNDIKDEETGIWPFIIFSVITLGVVVPVSRYWLADVSLASSQKQNKYFQATQDGQYLVKAYQDATDAFKLNNHEPVIASELSNAAAYLALALPAQSSDSARQLAQIALATSNQAIMASPYHPNYYKSRARSLILLSDFNPSYLDLAAKTLEAAMLISPTDPRLPFNLGVVYKYLNKTEEAKKMFNKSLELKPDFADPKKQLDEMKPNP
jgi:tetratricopeptide (TPR) repeat protein